MEINETLIGLIKEHLETDSKIDTGSPLVEIGYDSLKFIELVVRIEATMDVEFEDEYLNYSHFETVGKIADYISLRKKDLV